MSATAQNIVQENVQTQSAERAAETGSLTPHETMLAEFFENAPVGFDCLALDGTILRTNRAQLQMLGYSENEYVGRRITEFHTQPQAIEEQLKLLARGETVRGFEARLKCKDGSTREVVVDANPLLRGGRPSQIGATNRDITPLKESSDQSRRYQSNLEKLLMERTREYEQCRADLDSFSYIVSHDLRAPLRAMQGFADALLDDYGQQLKSEGREFAARIVGGARRMDLLIQDLLAYSRVGHTEIHLGSVRLDAVLKESLIELHAEAAESGAAVTVESPLPSVLAHRGLLVQAVTQVLSNALKFVLPGTAPRVRVHADTSNDLVRLWIEDNGIGIAPEHHSRIFGVFVRLHGVENYPGTGIGLAIVRRAMERMGGRAGVESKIQQGSRVWIELPAKDQIT